MAIDSALKRKCVLSVGVMGIWGLGVTPNALEPVAWRQSVSRGYCGIPAGAAVPVVRTYALSGESGLSGKSGSDLHRQPGWSWGWS